MKRFDTQTLESDLHRLDLRFASLRLQQPRMVERLARSIEQNGQLVPVVAVAEPDRWVLIDGYLRIEALRRLARDTAWVELWDCPLDQALLIVLVRVQGRPWEAIEEGVLLMAKKRGYLPLLGSGGSRQPLRYLRCIPVIQLPFRRGCHHRTPVRIDWDPGIGRRKPHDTSG
jgi:hypothetical protein